MEMTHLGKHKTVILLFTLLHQNYSKQNEKLFHCTMNIFGSKIGNSTFKNEKNENASIQFFALSYTNIHYVKCLGSIF